MEALVGNAHYNPTNSDHLAMVGGFAGDHIAAAGHALSPSFHGLCTPYGLSLDGNAAGMGQGVMIPYEHEQNEDPNAMEVKPNTKLLALEWQDQEGCSEKVESYGFINGIGSSWNGMMNGYGSSTTNPLPYLFVMSFSGRRCFFYLHPRSNGNINFLRTPFIDDRCR